MQPLAEPSPHTSLEFKRRQTCLKSSYAGKPERETIMLLLLLLVVLLLALAPAWPYSRSWGYYPSGALGAVLLIVIALVLFGQLRL